MAQYPTKVLANVGQASPSSPGNQGYTGKYYIYNYWVTGTPAAVTTVPIGAAPCKCHYVGMSAALFAGQAGTTTITCDAIKIPYDTGTPATVNTTAAAFGTTVVAFPANTQSINFDGAGVVKTHGANGSSAGTGATDAVALTTSTINFRQGDLVAVTTSGTFTGATGLMVQIVLQEDNGAY